MSFKKSTKIESQGVMIMTSNFMLLEDAIESDDNNDES